MVRFFLEKDIVEVEVEKREISESPGLSISFEYRLGGCRR
jgi:hypothetical protein